MGICISYQNGYAYTSTELNKDKIGLPVIKSGNLMTYEVVLKSNNDYVASPTDKMLSSIITKGDLLMCLSSQSDNPEPLGKTAIYKNDTPALLNQRVLKMRPYMNDILEILYITINSEYFHYTVSHQGSGSAQANLKLDHVLNMLIPLPPIEEQKRITNKVAHLTSKITKYNLLKITLDKLNGELNEILKKSILQYAIQGKLVSQEPSDEPASELLKRIETEKEQLIKTGKIKRDKNSSVIFKGDDNKYYEKVGGKEIEITDDIPYELPVNWNFVRLSNLCWLDDGYKSTGEKLPYMDAKYHRGKSEVTYLTQGKIVNPPCKVILVDGENSGEIFDITEKGYLGSTFKVLQISKCISDEWLHILLNNYRDLFKNSKVGAAIPHLNKNLFRNLIVGLPPIEEQRRIVEKITKINKGIEG